MTVADRAKKVADRLIWRPALTRSSAASTSEKVTTMRFRDLPENCRPGDWLRNVSPAARCAYMVLEIGDVGPSGYRRLVLESHPVSEIPELAVTWDFQREKRG